MRACLVFWVILCSLSTSARAQPTSCDAPPAGYKGPCYFGIPPAFFDDFAYHSALTQGDVGRAPEGDLFGTNTWQRREGTEQTRAWYRYNRDDLPIPGTISFREPSIMRLELPASLASAGYDRPLVVATDYAAAGGTYAWRVRLSELWEGQRVRHALWTYSNQSFVFDRFTPTDTTRIQYWSELDFENENHFQGERHDGVFIPDYVTRMSVGNHYGLLKSPRGSQRMSRHGPVPGTAGRGKLARNGPGRGPAAEAAPLIPSWADEWLYLIAEVDGDRHAVTYRMLPERPSGALAALGRVDNHRSRTSVEAQNTNER